jgi:hypothetical protein
LSKKWGAGQESQQGRLIVTSVWRNPERNEHTGGVVNSRHQYGGAVDVVPKEVCLKYEDNRCVNIIQPSQLYCLLEHVSERMLEMVYYWKRPDKVQKAREDAISESGSTPVPCVGTPTKKVTHLHVEVDMQ